MYRIGELAERAHVSKRTIDYYTNLGLLTAYRSQSNYRYYDEAALEVLQFIERCKRMHIPLCEIKSLLEKQPDEVQEAAATEQVEHLVRQLQQLEGELVHMKPQLEKLTAEQKDLLRQKLSASALLQALMLWMH